jgi:hypothetical protein
MTGMMMEYIRKSVAMPEDHVINSDVEGKRLLEHIPIPTTTHEQ